MYDHPDIVKICLPLSHLDIKTFVHVRMFRDHSRLYLSNNSPWLVHFFEQKLYNHGRCSTRPYEFPTGAVLWDSEEPDQVQLAAKEQFSMGHGLIVSEEYDIYRDFFIFMADQDYPQINNLYLNDFPLLRRFIDYYKGKANKHLDQKNAIKIPDLKLVKNENTYSSIETNKIEAFYNETNLGKLHLVVNNKELTLSKQQHQCARLLHHGLTVKEVAAKMGISPRTCCHYIDHIKHKFDVYSKTRLLTLLNQLFMRDYECSEVS